MGLSREAIIKLRRPSSDTAQNPENWEPPTTCWLQRKWHVTHSTHAPARYHGRKNARVELRLARDDEMRYTVELSSQDEQTLSIGSSSSMLESLDFDREKKTASRFKLSGSPSAEWEVLAWGKEGQLEEWMIVETNGMISDPGGEWRPDWRHGYAVVLIRDEKDAGRRVVEVWNDGGELSPLSGETIGKMRDALKSVGIEDELHPLVVDGGREQDDQEKWRAAQGPVCTDIILDEEEPKSKWCCFL